jgi:hypothetical protein
VRALAGYGNGYAAGGGYYVQVEHDATSMHDVYAVYRLVDGMRAVFAPTLGGTQIDAVAIDIVATDELVLDTPGILWRVDPRTLTFS